MNTWKTRSGYRIIQILSGRSNVFLLTNGEKNILIDTSVKLMWNTLKDRLNRLNINHIDYLILTHTHYDHADNAKRIKEYFKALIIVHKNEAHYLETGEMIIPFASSLTTIPLLNVLSKKIGHLFGCEPCEYDLATDEKFNLNDFGFNAYILHTPGHTFGSVSVIVDDEIAVVGDTMVGRWFIYPPFVQDNKQLMLSWGKLLATDCSLFIPAHGSANSRLSVEKEFNKRIFRNDL